MSSAELTTILARGDELKAASYEAGCYIIVDSAPTLSERYCDKRLIRRLHGIAYHSCGGIVTCLCVNLILL